MRTHQQGVAIVEVVAMMMLIAVAMVAAIFASANVPRCTSEKTLRDGVVEIVDRCPSGAEAATPPEN